MTTTRRRNSLATLLLLTMTGPVPDSIDLDGLRDEQRARRYPSLYLQVYFDRGSL